MSISSVPLAPVLLVVFLVGALDPHACTDILLRRAPTPGAAVPFYFTCMCMHMHAAVRTILYT